LPKEIPGTFYFVALILFFFGPPLEKRGKEEGKKEGEKPAG